MKPSSSQQQHHNTKQSKLVSRYVKRNENVTCASAGGLRNRHVLTARWRHEQKEFKRTDAGLTAAAAALTRAPLRAYSINSVNSVAMQIVNS
ncbi:hypothetical protein EVAR_98202_1 [Eumeta japonica]|uniref:Uncharacterized protein n=1 Tax=Eumeta variegata TaxID=151549 RepID=A0A4C1Y720_EUMVA|nr:hypothetical protein EVAR_98202_1 [Eumeta japonica]